MKTSAIIPRRTRIIDSRPGCIEELAPGGNVIVRHMGEEEGKYCYSHFTRRPNGTLSSFPATVETLRMSR